MTDARIPIGAGATPQALDLRLANRHGLIAGATGTGKTVTLQVLAEGFSGAGVPVFMADVKGDLAGLSQPGTLSERIAARLRQMAITDWAPAGSPAVFWDLFGEQGHPVRTTVSEMGPLLLARVLELNDTQEGVLNVVFRLADDDGLLLLDLADLRAMLAFAAEHAADVSRRYGNVSATSVSAIQRRLLVLEQQGAAGFFGEPALELADLMRTDAAGRGRISILAADRLLQSPRLYATFLLWLLAELFEDLPEIGDQDKPRLVFFFDEAHLLFDDAPRTLVARIEQVVRLIRSKGVGVYFITQSPLDLPDTVLGQLGNRVQHALRAFTPADQKTVRAVAQTFRVNPAFDPVAAVTQLEVGEALVSTLDASGAPTMVERTRIRPPCSRIGPISAAERAACLAASPVAGRYDRGIDRISAHEVLADRARAADSAQAAERAPPPAPRRYEAPLPAPRAGRPPGRAPAGRRGDTVGEALAKSVARSVGSTVGRQIVRGILGALFRGR